MNELAEMYYHNDTWSDNDAVNGNHDSINNGNNHSNDNYNYNGADSKYNNNDRGYDDYHIALTTHLYNCLFFSIF